MIRSVRTPHVALVVRSGAVRLYHRFNGDTGRPTRMRVVRLVWRRAARAAWAGFRPPCCPSHPWYGCRCPGEPDGVPFTLRIDGPTEGWCGRCV